ncbi:MAG TPA: asparagine synthase (glutamine-hydrolyzing) [Pyrinomonadaceae bacterium]|nr:asparagine synthase (glutamine-hydrolyzing) [Pyrinomonadaceae bacterium]
MCGIVGNVWRGEAAVDPAVLGRMCDAIRHRGPDEEGSYLKGPAGLAMRRLSIIDVAGGHQPVTNRDRTAWLVFNGEIYNYRELRDRLAELGHEFHTNSDTEVVLQAYERYGADCPKHLRGMFAFAIYDERTEELLLARDRVGKKPLLYALTPRGIVFGSEFSALLQHPDVGREVDREAIHHYLSFMCVPAPLTAYRQIRKLEPGHTLRYSRRTGDVKTERYWRLDFSKKIKISEEEAGERTVELLRDAVRVRLMSEVPLGAFLSGGVDSSAVVALMSEEMSEPVKTFSIGFDEQDFSELHHARRVAEHVGADHHEFVVRPEAMEVLPLLVEHYGEPYADSSAIPTYYVSRETRRHVTVALNGDGGDECFAGYERYAAMKLASAYRKLPGFLREGFIRQAAELIPASEQRRSRARSLKRFLSAASLPHVERYVRWVSAIDSGAKRELYTEEFRRETEGYDTEDFIAPWFAQANGSGVVDAALLADTMTYLPNDLLVKVDIASMAVSLEARSPFLDHHLIEFAASLPENLKLRGLTTKYILKRVLKQLLPEENLKRPKQGFGVPVGHWLRAGMQGFLRETLLSEKFARRNLFRPAEVGRMVELHARGERDYTGQLWTLLMLELWFQKFIDR